MNILVSLKVLLVLHLTGLTVMAGTTVADYLALKEFARLFQAEREKSHDLLRLMERLSVMLGVGAALLIVSGVGMLLITRGVFLKQAWFHLKLLLILVLVLNGILLGRKQVSKLKKWIDLDAVRSMKAIRNLQVFYLGQLGVFFVIIFLSVFKFN